MRSMTIATALYFAIVGLASAQTSTEHEGHHPNGTGPTAQAAPAQPAAPAAPQAQPPAGAQMPMGQKPPSMSGDPMKQMGDMMGMMRKMMPMMEGMQKPDVSPSVRADMMKQMAPMMQQMMPMMQQMMPMMMGGMNPATTSPASASMPQHVRAYMQAMDKMHGPMSTGVAATNPDEGFVRGMIPHHQGAIDMAKVALQYAKDEQVRKWANDVIREQQREISEMEAWLKKNAK